MEMQELQAAWNALDARLAEGQARLARMERQHSLDAVRSRLRGLTWRHAAQAVVGTLIVLWAGGYWWDQAAHAHRLAYGLALHAYGIALLGSAVAQAVLLARVRYDGPVLAVQGHLHALRRQRIRHGRGLVLAAVVAWVPALFAVLERAGMDVYLQRPAVVWWNLAAALALLPFAWWLLRRKQDPMTDDAVVRAVAQSEADLAGLGDGER